VTPGLWRNRDFRLLWCAHTVSQFGSQVTLLALPLTAILVLRVTPFEMGLLTAAGTAPYLVFALLAGVWIDRAARRRPILVVADLGRAALLATIPVAALLGLLSIAQLIAVALLAGTLGVFFTLANFSYLPGLVERDQLVEANSRVMTSYSAAQVAGPGLAGLVVQAIGAPLALASDAVSFLISALLLGQIQAVEARPAPERQASLWGEIATGLRLVAADPLQRAIAGSAATLNFFGLMLLSIFLLYATQQLDLSAEQAGLVLAAGGVGGLLGAALASRAASRLGPERAILGAALVFPLSLVLVPLAGRPPALALAILAAGEGVSGLAVAIFDVNAAALRQAATPPHLLGRTSASLTFITQSAKPLGAFLGGALGEVLGLRPTLWTAAAGGLGVLAWVWFSPLGRRAERPGPCSVAQPQEPWAG
jgi:MFS family permease